VTWAERRLLVRSGQQAQAAEATLRARGAKAKAVIEGLNPSGRGKKRFAERESLCLSLVL